MFTALLTTFTAWFAANPTAASLCCLMGLDITMGTVRAFKEKVLNSAISRAGIARKIGILILVAAGFVLAPLSHGIPVGTLAALGFCTSETLSIVENAAKIGIPVPQVIIDVLGKLRGEKAPPITINTIVHQPVLPAPTDDSNK